MLFSLQLPILYDPSVFQPFSIPGIKAISEYYPGILIGKPPIDKSLFAVPAGLPCGCSLSDGPYMAYPPAQALFCQGIQLDFLHVQPTSLLGRIRKIEPIPYSFASGGGKASYRAPGLWAERLSFTRVILSATGYSSPAISRINSAHQSAPSFPQPVVQVTHPRKQPGGLCCKDAYIPPVLLPRRPHIDHGP